MKKRRKKKEEANSHFYSIVKGRQARNEIKCLLDNDGTRVEDPNTIKERICCFYNKFLGSSTAVNEKRMMISKVALLFSYQIPESMKSWQRNVTKHEIQQALFSMERDKAPRPDGFIDKFFKEALNTVKRLLLRLFLPSLILASCLRK